ncbi:MAG: helix-turn-helix domain-containing protein [Okeania sp. SIO2G4]|uniref:helix-turn-helix domain-containing protein n=1 Tax=unclassified Okeania TaxID=2634635 RepID=UPI0013B82875|nr:MULTISPECIES: helix-turn-helix domain-containing protein [unclassified Okeania]NEP03701.1 helix-turn-helix domain-containing protein [Okeania sp. SIO4D6]NEP38293.1 helix-turn-helix domain-containing protein [Okeania sp. SIO2H7]NEP73327.1 helix-turn-helix domain-containing protein [Okeania sp. SIO2G5]NEP94156.1 helix-turn-helix domain-containing protein [Okeania sp. SIO2F5]NEQ92006.1 helix-turn-helix domain-containing protein [Okeania sp. SIO2G4]
MTQSFATTTQAAFLLNISTGRLRELLNQGRVRDARKVGRLWMIPLNHRGMPEIKPGRRGPEGTWNKNRRSGNTFVHVLRKTIDYNRDYETSHPVVAVKVGDKKDYCHALKIHGPCQIVYQPHNPNKSQAGGARLWIEVEPQYIVERVYFSDGDYGPPPEVTEQRAKLKKKKLQKKKLQKKKSKIKGKRK